MRKKIALVTGASRGIGRCIAIELAKEGYDVIINYNTSQAEAEAVLAQVQEISDGILIKADVSDIGEVKRMTEIIRDKYGYINALINNAGKIIRPGNWREISQKDWNRTYMINAKGAYNCICSMQSLFSSEEIGHIVNIVSTVGKNGGSEVVAYGAAKAALANMTLSFAKAFAPRIVVNAVSPGNIDTAMTSEAGGDVVDWVIEATPLKRLGYPEEVAYLVAFLCSSKSNFITGQIIDIDGGYSLGN